MEAAYAYFGTHLAQMAQDIHKIQSKIKEMQRNYFMNSSSYGNMIMGYNFTARAKKPRDSMEQVFSRRQIASIFQLIPVEEKQKIQQQEAKQINSKNV